MRKCRESWDCWAWRRKVSRRTFINDYKYLKWEGKEDRPRLFSVVSMTTENGHKVNTGGSLWTRRNIFSVWAWLSSHKLSREVVEPSMEICKSLLDLVLGNHLWVILLEAGGVYQVPAILRYFGILRKERHWNCEQVGGIHQTGNIVHLSTWTVWLLVKWEGNFWLKIFQKGRIHLEEHRIHLHELSLRFSSQLKEGSSDEWRYLRVRDNWGMCVLKLITMHLLRVLYITEPEKKLSQKLTTKTWNICITISFSSKYYTPITTQMKLDTVEIP